MELLQLRYFMVIAKYQSFTKAAAELMVSQPALSKTIKSLEDQLGAKLFDRRGKSVQLNRAGEVFYRSVSKSLNAIDDAALSVSDMAHAATGKLHLLVQAATTFFVNLYISFHKKYPNIKLYISNYLQNEQLLANDYDVHIHATFGNISLKDSAELLTERFVLAVPPENPLAQKKCIELAEAEPYPFIASSDRFFIEDTCRRAGFAPDIAFQCDNGYTYNTLLEHNLGCTIVPEITIAHTLPKNLVIVPFVNPEVRRTLVLSCNSNRYITKAAELFRAEAMLYTAKYAQISG